MCYDSNTTIFRNNSTPSARIGLGPICSGKSLCEDVNVIRNKNIYAIRELAKDMSYQKISIRIPKEFVTVDLFACSGFVI